MGASESRPPCPHGTIPPGSYIDWRCPCCHYKLDPGGHHHCGLEAEEIEVAPVSEVRERVVAEVVEWLREEARKPRQHSFIGMANLIVRKFAPSSEEGQRHE